jgi:hypothetical protein
VASRRGAAQDRYERWEIAKSTIKKIWASGLIVGLAVLLIADARIGMLGRGGASYRKATRSSDSTPIPGGAVACQGIREVVPMHVQGAIVIERPVDKVFDFVADERNEPKYNLKMTRAEMVTPEPIGVGSQFNAVMTGTGRATEMTIEFTEFERPNRLESKTHLSNMEIAGTLCFEPISEGTRMRWFWDIRPRGFLRLLGPIVRRLGEHQEQEIWAGLKRVLEEQSEPQMASKA